MQDRKSSPSASPTLHVVQQAPGTLVRPKAMRRPAQFASQAVAAPAPAELAPTTSQAASKPQVVTRPWQDDGRFAMTLLAVIILMNIAVSAWLSAISGPALPSRDAPVSPPSAAAESPQRDTIHILDDAASASSDQ